MASSSVPQQRRRSVFTFEEIDAPEDELHNMLKSSNSKRKQPTPKSKPTNHFLDRDWSSDDEDRVPPPMEVDLVSASSKYPDFEAWQREMKDTLLGGSADAHNLQLHDLRAARIQKRNEIKKLRLQKLHQQLRSVRSDTSNDVSCQSTLLDDDNHASSFDGENNSPNSPRAKPVEDFKKSKSEEPIVNHIYVKREKVGKARRRSTQSLSAAVTEEPPAPPTSSPKKEQQQQQQQQPNQQELAAIMEELAELKVWATTANASLSTSSSSSSSSAPPVPTTITTTRLRQSTPPSSPTSPRPPFTTPSIALPELQVPILVSPPISPTAVDATAIQPKSGLCIETTITPVALPKPAMKKSKTTQKSSKSVRFPTPEITDTIYRPKTPREEVNNLYFQEDELLDWEHDEETTPIDRFEVVVTEFDDSSSFKIGTPVVSFHNTYSFSFQEDDDSDIDYTDDEKEESSL